MTNLPIIPYVFTRRFKRAGGNDKFTLRTLARRENTPPVGSKGYYDVNHNSITSLCNLGREGGMVGRSKEGVISAPGTDPDTGTAPGSGTRPRYPTLDSSNGGRTSGNDVS